MTGRRIGAVLVAVALIAGAIVLRRVVLADDDATPSGSTGPPTEVPAEAGQLICITELQAVCAAVRAEHPELSVTVQDAGTTLDALAALADDAPRPVWLTLQPFPAMVDELRASARRDPLGGAVEPVASSRLAIATPPGGRADVLTASCGSDPLWRCIGFAAGNPWTDIGGEAAWGRVRPSLGAVDRHAVALASFAAAVAGYVGRPDIRSSDWQDDPAFTPWLNQLAGAVDVAALSAGTPLATMANRPSALDIAATTDAEVAALGGDRFVVNYPEPSMWVEAVLAVPDGTAVPDDLVPALAAAATAAGWDAPTAATQPLPGATTMLALRARWQETL